MTLIGKTVKIADPHLLCYFYPDFTIANGINILTKNKKVIYIGKKLPNLLDRLKSNTKSFINTVGKSDINLDNPLEMLKFVYAKWNKAFPDNEYTSYLLALPKRTFIQHCKHFWMFGESEMNHYHPEQADLLSFFREWAKSSNKDCSSFHKLSESFNDQTLEFAILRFINRAFEESHSPFLSQDYISCLKAFSARVSKDRVVKVLARYRALNCSKRTGLLFIVWALSDNRIGGDIRAYR